MILYYILPVTWCSGALADLYNISLFIHYILYKHNYIYVCDTV